ncbi:hypothetical protein [Sphingomonas oryzagri]
MDEREENRLRDDVMIAQSLGAVAFVGLSAALSELEASGRLSQQARQRIRNFMVSGIEEMNVPERTKAHVRSMLRAHFPGC